MDTGFITINAPSSLRIDAGPGAVCYVDPYLPKEAPHDADLILVTHSHHDHFSPDDIKRVAKANTRFVAPRGMELELSEALFVSPGETCCPLPSISVEAVPAYNVGKKFHPRANGWVGYIITTHDGTTVYVAGDTDDLPENRALACDIALVPVGGTYTMTAEEAAVFVNALQPKVAIPEHYGSGVGSKGDGKRFAKLVDPGIKVVFKL